jgi:hypothetical protein
VIDFAKTRGTVVPVISAFYGMIIKIYHCDHNPPHFHVEYGSQEILIEIKTGKALAGYLSPRLLREVKKWRKIHIKEILQSWEDAQNHKTPKKVEPLE